MRERVGLWRLVQAVGVMLATEDALVRQLVDSVGPDDDLSLRELGALGMPTTLVWGGEERVLHPSQLEWLRANLPGHARVIEPEGLGHAAWFEHADELAELFREFLARLA